MKGLVFVHIPKCGGTSFAVALKKTFGNEVYRDLSFRKDRNNGIIQLTDRSERNYPYRFDPDRFSILMGHFTVNKYLKLRRPVVTFLRDPVERIISYYSVWKTTRRYHPMNEDKNIFWFAERCKNVMWQMTDGNLDLFDFVGITERHEESMKLMENKLGIRFVITKIKRNKTPEGRKLNFSGRTYRILEEMNQMDRVIYNKALERFEEEKLNDRCNNHRLSQERIAV